MRTFTTCACASLVPATLPRVALTAAVWLAATAVAHAQGTPAPAQPVAKPIVYPSKGQTAEQQKKDTSECYAWAQQQTGYDPVAALHAQQAAAAKSQQDAQAVQNAQKSVGGETVGGAARGAVAGVAIGAIAGDAGKGAAIGATTGALSGTARNRAKNKQVQQAGAQVQQAQASQQAAANQQLAEYQRNWGACMEGRNYVVK